MTNEQFAAQFWVERGRVRRRHNASAQVIPAYNALYLYDTPIAWFDPVSASLVISPGNFHTATTCRWINHVLRASGQRASCCIRQRWIRFDPGNGILSSFEDGHGTPRPMYGALFNSWEMNEVDATNPQLGCIASYSRVPPPLSEVSSSYVPDSHIPAPHTPGYDQVIRVLDTLAARQRTPVRQVVRPLTPLNLP